MVDETNGERPAEVSYANGAGKAGPSRSPFRRVYHPETVEFCIARVGGEFCRRRGEAECDPYSGNVWDAPTGKPRSVKLARFRAEKAMRAMHQPTDGGRLEIRERTIPAGRVLTMSMKL